MNITFKCKINKDYIAINSLSCRLKNGSEIIIDRDTTQYDINDDMLTMTWKNTYLWGIDGNFVFDQGNSYLDGDSYKAAEKLLDGAKVWFNYESEADGDYKVTIEEMFIYDRKIKLAKRFEPEAFLEALSAEERDAVYRALWKEHVVEDMYSEMDGMVMADLLPDDEKATIADMAAERYVYEGDYDCNLDYWTNIRNLLTDPVNEKAREVLS